MTIKKERLRSLSRLVRMPANLAAGLIAKGGAVRSSLRLTRKGSGLPFGRPLPPFYSASLRDGLVASSDGPLPPLPPEDAALVDFIRSETEKRNRNNITRTAAYLDIYLARPELHWALLAHLVSRNGGWSMTDLQGEWLPELLDTGYREAAFGLLEACNSLIFGDAYPQLLLYIESRRIGRDLTPLLPRFGASAFMKPFWRRFIEDGNPLPLSEALIVNEQHFIQSRVVEDEFFAENVLNAPAFRLQPLLQTNQIVLPLLPETNDNRTSLTNKPLTLVGRVLENFPDLRERIAFGRCLYRILFGYPAVLSRALAFATSTPHSGSRSDYWPLRFSPAPAPAPVPGAPANEKAGVPPVATGKDAGGSPNAGWRSPRLGDAWEDRPPRPSLGADWFVGLEQLKHLRPCRMPRIIDMTHEHLLGQNKFQTAVLLERSFMNGASKRRTGRG
ncbi:DUF2515 family protein [Cohnella suwonensis]|uniref:DUF2515 family protein n=1 Tax=Cohnella suwonensis TaxID=696072 RepID=A0ABW0LVN4_9BACL